MPDLPDSTWREIEKQSVYLAGKEALGRYVGLGTLRTILRKRRRTNDQNALLWSVYEDILARGGEQLGGWTKDDLHEFFLIEHFGSTVHEAFGRRRLRPLRRSSRLSKPEFSDFLEFIFRKCAEYGIEIERPQQESHAA